MKRIIPLILVLLLFSCSKKASDFELALKKDSCKRSISDNEQLFAAIKNLYEETGKRTLDSAIVANCERIVSWRRNFIDYQSQKSLLQYSDSVEAMYLSLRGVSDEVLQPVIELKNQLKTSSDSSKFYNLLYFTIAAERLLLEKNAQYLGVACGPKFYVTSFLNKEEYDLLDTVYLTLNATEVYFGNADFNFSKVTCTIPNSKVSIKPEIIKSGPHYILIYRPIESGIYKIEGDILIKQEGNFVSRLSIENEFNVKNTKPNKT